MAKINKIKLPDGVTYDVQDTVSGYVSTEATTSAKGLMSASDKTKLNGIASGAEVNQNAFSNIKVGSTTVVADAKTDTLEFVAGDNVILTPDATNDKITISSELPPTTKSIDNLPQPIASFNDGADAPLKSLTVSIEPQQDLHGYDSPWVGGAGKNKFDIEGWLNSAGATYTKSGNSYTISAISTLFTTPFTFYDTDVPISISTSSYVGETATNVRMTLLDSNNNIVGSFGANNSYQKKEGLVASKVRFDWSQAGTFTITEPQIELGTTATPYAPYSNICPISGWDEAKVSVVGKNLFDKTTIAENKIINSNTGEEIAFYGRFSSDYIKVKSSTDYYATDVIRAAQWYCVFYYDKNKNYLSCTELPSTGDTASGVMTTPSNCVYVRLVGQTTYKDDVSLVVGNQAPSTYEPYNGTTTTIPFVDGQGNALTVYNGNIEVISGSLTDNRDKNFVDFSTVPIIKNDVNNPNDYLYYIPGLPVDKNKEIICSHAPSLNRPPIGNILGIAVSGSGSIYINLTSDIMTTNTVEYLKQYCTNNNVQILYTTTSTPTTYPQHPTSIKSLDGENNLWASTGQINDVVYLTQPYTGITANLAGYAYESSKASIADTASSVAWTNVTEKPSTYTPASHTHGNIQNGGTLQTNDVTIASGDKLVVTDSSDSNKVARTSVSFDGSTATKCLTQKGTWESFSNNTGTVTSVKVGTTSYTPSSGVVSLPAYPTTLPASDVYSWAKASSKPSYSASEVGAIATTAKGAANGVAELDANGLVPSSQLPSYVDDVLEYSAKSSFPTTGETGKIYVDTSTNLTYRWSGTAYIEISPSLALGTTSSTAYRGDYGNTAYTHATDANRLTTAKTEGLYKIATTAEGHIKSVTAVAKSDITGLGIPGSDTNTHRPIQVNGTQILGDNTTALNLKAGGNVSVTNSSGTVTIAATDTKYTATTASIGSASAGTAIAADDITAWSTNTPTSCTISKGVLTFSAGSAASLSYTARSIPNISVTSKTVATGITAS